MRRNTGWAIYTTTMVHGMRPALYVSYFYRRMLHTEQQERQIVKEMISAHLMVRIQFKFSMHPPFVATPNSLCEFGTTAVFYVHRMHYIHEPLISRLTIPSYAIN